MVMFMVKTRSVVPLLVVPLEFPTTTHFSFSRVFFCVSVSTRFSPGANGGGGGGGAFGTSDGSGGGAGTANKKGAKIGGYKMEGAVS